MINIQLRISNAGQRKTHLSKVDLDIDYSKLDIFIFNNSNRKAYFPEQIFTKGSLNPFHKFF